MFDIEKFRKIKKLYKLILINELIIVFSAFGFVYTIFMGQLIFMLYVVCLAGAILLRFYLKSKIELLK